MPLKLIPNWRVVLTKAWSVRLMTAAIVLSGVEAALPIVDQILFIPRGLFAGLSAVTTGAALWARFSAQKGITNGS